MNSFWSECIEQDDEQERVLHQVHGALDGIKYKIQFSASCPMTAIKIAREVPIQYWEKE